MKPILFDTISDQGQSIPAAVKRNLVVSKTAVSRLPNDVMEKVNGEEYPQEYMSPSPGGMGSVRPGDDPILTGSYKLPDAEAIPTPDQLPQPKKKDVVGRMIRAAVHQELVRRAMTMNSRRTL